MTKMMFFPLWKVEKLEHYLESMEENGWRLESVICSYWFRFVQDSPKKVHYFLSCKSFGGQVMGACDDALPTEHGAQEIKTKMSFYSLHRTEAEKEDLAFLCEERSDYIRVQLLENLIIWLLLVLLFALYGLAQFMTTSSCFWFPFAAICLFPSAYYFYGYFKQKKNVRLRKAKIQKEFLYRICAAFSWFLYGILRILEKHLLRTNGVMRVPFWISLLEFALLIVIGLFLVLRSRETSKATFETSKKSQSDDEPTC